MTSFGICPRRGYGHFARYLTYLGFLMSWFGQTSSSGASDDPFAFLRPSITITSSERAQLDSGRPFSRVLPAKDPEVAVLAVTPVNVDGDRLLAWERRVEELKKSSYVLAIGRFSNPPRIEDLAGLELDTTDIAALRACRPRNCDVKLSGAEMKQLQRVETRAKGDAAAAVQQAFRRIVLNRVQQYLATGHIPPGDDHPEKVQPAARFATLLDHTPFLMNRLPQLAAYLRDYPSRADPQVESLLYWSKENLATKAVISVTHLSMERRYESDLPDILVVGRNIFSTHYINASLSVTALVRGDSNRTNYLLYLNRTEVDTLQGAFGNIIRHSIEAHLKNATSMLADLRQRLESGTPGYAVTPAPTARRGPPRRTVAPRHNP